MNNPLQSMRQIVGEHVVRAVRGAAVLPHTSGTGCCTRPWSDCAVHLRRRWLARQAAGISMLSSLQLHLAASLASPAASHPPHAPSSTWSPPHLPAQSLHQTNHTRHTWHGEAPHVASLPPPPPPHTSIHDSARCACPAPEPDETANQQRARQQTEQEAHESLCCFPHRAICSGHPLHCAAWYAVNQTLELDSGVLAIICSAAALRGDRSKSAAGSSWHSMRSTRSGMQTPPTSHLLNQPHAVPTHPLHGSLEAKNNLSEAVHRLGQPAAQLLRSIHVGLLQTNLQASKA